jgi:hypothetical protein
LITLGTPFYIGTSEFDREKFMAKWSIPEITPEEERTIMEQNQPVFDKINEIF